MKWTKFLTVCIAAIALIASPAHAQIGSDNAANYAAGWTNESNGGTGFGPWSFSVNPGTGSAGSFVGDPSFAGVIGMTTETFGLYANPPGSGASVTNIRPFSAALNVGETFAIQWGINWDGDNGANGNKGFSIWGNGAELIRINNAGNSDISVNGVNVGFGFGTAAMNWTFTLVANDTVLVQANDRDGTGSLATNITVASAPDALAIYAFNLGAGDQRQPYFNNLQILAAPSLAFTPDSASPTNTGEFVFTLTRELGGVGDEIALSSDNTNAVTVPTNVMFGSSETSVSFTGSVVSLIAGSATITASEGAVSDTFTVNIPLPGLTISGPAGVFLGTTNTYTVTRTGFMTNAIDLSSSAPGTVSVPASVEITSGNSVTFEAVAEAVGAAGLTATDSIATSAVLNVTVVSLPPTPTNIYDDATFYPLGWADGDNRGNGFTAWFLNANNGGVFVGAATNQALNHSALDVNNVSFGMYASGFSEASRGLLNSLNVGDTLTFSIGFLWDDGNRGFDIFAGGGPAVFNLDVSSAGYSWTGGGVAGPTPWQDDQTNSIRENGVVLDVVITAIPGGFDYDISTIQDTNVVITGSVASAQVSGFKFYVSGTPGGGGNDMYFNKLAVVAATNAHLQLTGPTSVLDVATPVYTLTRNSTSLVSDVVYLESSSPAAGTVSSSVTFDPGSLNATFRLNTIAAGTTTLTATNNEVVSTPLVVDVTAGPTNIHDLASYYYGQWFNGDSNGNGFGSWSFNHAAGTGFAGSFIGDPASAGIAGMDSASFGFYADPAGAGANAEVSRNFSNPLAEGEQFSFVWGLNFDSGDAGSNRGFELYAGAEKLININMANTAELYITITNEPSGLLMLANYGVNAITVSIARVSADSLRVTSTGRDGVESFDQTFTAVGTPDSFKFYFNGTANEDSRKMFVNNLAVTTVATGPELPTNAVAVSAFTITGGQPNVTVAAEAGLYYYLVYPTVAMSDVTANPVNLAQWSIADAEGPVAANGNISLQDTSAAVSNRVYGVLIRTQALAD